MFACFGTKQIVSNVIEFSTFPTLASTPGNPFLTQTRPLCFCTLILGVDYLTPGALTESMSYVFGPVLKLLQSVGYKNGIDLDAAPYDWRIPVSFSTPSCIFRLRRSEIDDHSTFCKSLQPSELQSRDQYFTNTMKKIEQLYYQSNDTPVVILCHSMGCKTAHYLFNFVLKHLGAISGQSWLNKYVLGSSCHIRIC